MIKQSAKELKKFVSKYTKEAINAGYKPSRLTFYEIQQPFDYDLFSRNVHTMRNGKFPEKVYFLLLLTCIFLNKGIVYRNSKTKKSFFDWTLEYVGANDIILNEVFGEFKKEVFDLHEIVFDDAGDGYFEIFGRIYTLEMESFVEYWIYNHFLCEGCIPVGNTFLMDINFTIAQDVLGALELAVGLTEEFQDYLEYLYNNRLYPDTGDFQFTIIDD